MALNGYTIAVNDANALLNRVADDEELPAAQAALQSGFSEAADACGSTVAAAVEELWNNYVLLQCQAAQTRVGNAVAGMRTAVQAYVDGDAEMAESGRQAVNQVPRISSPQELH